MSDERRRGGRTGEVRAVVPLFGTEFPGLPEGRHLLALGVVLASLDKPEQERIRTCGGAVAKWRVEVHDLLPDFPSPRDKDMASLEETWEYKRRNSSLGDRVATLVALSSLSARLHPNHESVLADAWNGEKWVRIGPVRFVYSGSSHLTWSHFPEDRLSTWKTLIEHWPKSPTRQLSLAFDLYLDSIRERQQVMRGGAPFDKAMLFAAIAMEVLTGYGASNEITRTVAQRAAHLVADGEDAWNVYRAVKKLYGIRSKIVHEGTADAGVAGGSPTSPGPLDSVSRCCSSSSSWRPASPTSPTNFLEPWLPMWPSRSVWSLYGSRTRLIVSRVFPARGSRSGSGGVDKPAPQGGAGDRGGESVPRGGGEVRDG